VSADGRYALIGGGSRIQRNQLVPGAQDYDIRIWDMTRGTEHHRLTGLDSIIYYLALSPDASQVLIATGRPLQLLEVSSGHELKRMVGQSTFWSVAMAPSGRWAISASDRETEIRLWDLATGKEERRYSGHTEPVRRVIFTPDGSKIVSAALDGTVRLWDVKS